MDTCSYSYANGYISHLMPLNVDLLLSTVNHAIYGCVVGEGRVAFTIVVVVTWFLVHAGVAVEVRVRFMITVKGDGLLPQRGSHKRVLSGVSTATEWDPQQ